MKIQKPEARSQRAEVRGQRSEVRGREAKRGEGIGSQGRRVFLLICLLVAGLGISSQAQNTLNVTNYGAIGDAVQFYVNTISNSVVVTTTNTLPNSAIGEAIEVFAAGVPTTTTNNQDLVATITNIVNGTNIYVSQKTQATLTNTFATYGHNNTANFQSAITAVGKDTNDIINIPAGTYLLLTTNKSAIYGQFAILLQRGGINFVGTGTNSTTLLSQGAWTLIGGSPWRGFLVEVVSPVTNNFPVSFSYLTMDGGVQQGNTSNHGFPASIYNGTGWDETHDAFILGGGSSVSLYHEYFTNVSVQHWRGEEFKSIDGSTNGQIGIYNSTFSDGNATALNVYPAWDVRSNLFVNLFQVAEYYQAYSSYPSYFEYNVITNITGNGFAVNGGRGNNPPFYMENNVFYFPGTGYNGIETVPADNLYVISNQFSSLGYFCQALDISASGAQGSFENSNIVVAFNNFTHIQNVIELNGGSPTNITDPARVEDVQVFSNNISGGGDNGQALLINYGGYYTNVHFSYNIVETNSDPGNGNRRATVSSGAGRVTYVLVDTNNLYYSPIYDLSGITNIISYSSGSRFEIIYGFYPGTVWSLQDTNSSQMPLGAMIQLYNNNSHSSNETVYLNSSLSGTPVTVAGGQTALFYWLSWKNAWSTNGAILSGPPLPPANLRQNY